METHGIPSFSRRKATEVVETTVADRGRTAQVTQSVAVQLETTVLEVVATEVLCWSLWVNFNVYIAKWKKSPSSSYD